jgi:DNA excision repair protein ERCC-4
MTSSSHSCQSLHDYLSMMNPDAPRGAKGHRMLMKGLRGYLWWKKQLSHQKVGAKSQAMQQPSKAVGSSGRTDQGISPALKRKDKVLADKANSRRRIRGGATTTASTRSAGKAKGNNIQGAEELQEEVERIASL